MAPKASSTSSRRSRRSLPNSTRPKSTTSRGKTSQSRRTTTGKKTTAIRDPDLRRKQNEIIDECLVELDKLPKDPKTNKILRNLGKKVCDRYLNLNSSWLTINMIKGRRKRQLLKEKTKADENETSVQNTRPPTRPTNQVPLQQLKTAPKTGRKKGTTKAAIQDAKRRFVEMKDAIVRGWYEKENRPKNITLGQWILQNQKAYGFDTGKPEHRVTKSMVKSRMRRGQVENKGTKGQASPLVAIEPRIVALINASSKCNQELTKEEVLDFVNCYIEGSQLEHDLIEWKIRNHVNTRNNFVNYGIRPARADVSQSWFHGFLKRWNDEISYSKSRNTAHYRKEHCTYANFEKMYDSIYSLLEQHGYAKRLERPVFYNKVGKLCDESNAFGKPVDMHFIRPDLVLCADECGTNTNMSKDRLSGGNKRCHTKGMNVLLPACTSDVHFTTMGFTALDGRPVCCVVIIQKPSKLHASELYGFDVDAPWHGDLSMFDELKQKVKAAGEKKIAWSEIPDVSPELLAANLGPGKAFPGGPVCEFNGKQIPSFVTNSESGGITPEILVQVLQHLDYHIGWNRSDGEPPPALLLDGHGSRLSIPFLRYINNEDADGNEEAQVNHKWNVYVGLPNGTAYWQIADSLFINGRFKGQMRRRKEFVRKKQLANDEKIEIKRYHVVFLIRQCWATCFGDIEGNIKAIIERGWNPLNRACLVMPDIVKSRYKKGEDKRIDSTQNATKNDVSNENSNEKCTSTAVQPPEPPGGWQCAARHLCGVNNNPFTSKDYHKCNSCGKRVHGAPCCVEPLEHEEGRIFYCLICGRPNKRRDRGVMNEPAIDHSNKKPRSVATEDEFAKDSTHCSDMNPSGEACFRILHKIQQSTRRDMAIEQRIVRKMRLTADQRSDNKFMKFLFDKVTTGTLVNENEYYLSQKELKNLFELKKEMKDEEEQKSIDKKYRKELKVYREGFEAIEKERKYQLVLDSIAICSGGEKEKKKIAKEARKQKQWLLNPDFEKLIKFKLLSLSAIERKETKIPSKLELRKSEWYNRYKLMPNPREPVKPLGYIEVDDDDADVDNADDDDADEDVAMSQEASFSQLSGPTAAV